MSGSWFASIFLSGLPKKDAGSCLRYKLSYVSLINHYSILVTDLVCDLTTVIY